MWKIAGVTDELWSMDGRRQAAKWKGRICSPAILMENREMILQTDTSSWFVNLSELLRQVDMNRNIHMTLQPEESSSILIAGKVQISRKTNISNLLLFPTEIKLHVSCYSIVICSVHHLLDFLTFFPHSQSSVTLNAFAENSNSSVLSLADSWLNRKQLRHVPKRAHTLNPKPTLASSANEAHL